MNYHFRHPITAALAPLGYRSEDGRALTVSGHFMVEGVSPIYPDVEGVPPIGFITRVAAYDGFLWAHGAMATQHDSVALHAGTAVLCMDMDITSQVVTGEGFDISAGRVRAARFTTPDRWPWGEVRP